MNSQGQGSSSAQREANRQVLTCLAIGLFAGCAMLVVLALILQSLGPPIYSLLATQFARSSETTTVLYVSAEGTGRGCGSWDNACDLQTALQVAVAGDEIWVKAGVYTPAVGTRFPDATFQLKQDVALYGGFAGTETAREQRNWETQITVLSGDFGRDDTTDFNGVVTDPANIAGQNAYHVVSADEVSATAVLDGFVITAGHASLTPPNIHGYGGGMFNWRSSPTLSHLIFSGNTAGKGAAFYGGGGMFNSHSSNPTLTDVSFVANTAGSGGGMYNDGSSPTLIRVSFIGNRAIDDGGMVNYSNSSPTLEDVTFSGNVATRNAGGMGNHTNGNPILIRVTFEDNSAGDYGGGMGNYQSSPTLTDVEFSSNRAGREGGGMHNAKASSPVLTNVTFVGNSTAANGGGMLNSESSPKLTNVTFSGNTAGEFGGGLCNTFSSRPTLANVTFSGNRAPHGSALCNVGGSFKLVNGIVWGNTPAREQVYNDNVTPDITYSDIEGGFPGVGNLNVDPHLGGFGEHGGATRVFALPSDSPVIDQGSPSVCPATDPLGLPRPVDGDGDGSAICDMGAFEYRPDG
jgi:Chlamydia polymorphic membrane protein (Chlamydia_PMP) repeat